MSTYIPITSIPTNRFNEFLNNNHGIFEDRCKSFYVGYQRSVQVWEMPESEKMLKMRILLLLLQSSYLDIKCLATSSSGNLMTAAVTEYVENADSFAVFREFLLKKDV